MTGICQSFGSVRSIWFALLCLIPLVSLADSPTLDVTVNRDRVYLGESFLLEVKAGGEDNPTAPDLSAIQNCTIDFLGSQSSSRTTIIIVNGRMRKEGFSGRVFTYKLTPTTAGLLSTGPITARIAGNTLTASGSPVTVTGVTRQNIVSVSVTASRDTVLVDEPFDIRLAVKIRRLPGRYADADPIFPGDPPHLEASFLNHQDLDGLKEPDYPKLLNGLLVARNQPGFTINNYTVQADMFDFSAMMNPQGNPARFKLERHAVEENGKSFWEYSLTLPFSSQTESSYTFGPTLFKGNVPTSVDAHGQATGESIFAVGPAAIVRVIPPPEQDRPDSYIGAIGSNLVVEAALDAQTCNVGDPLTLTLSISGAVQMRNISPPKLALQPDLTDRFEIYDDTVKTLKQDQLRQYAYTLRPRQTGSFELPPINVSFYDVVARRYQTVSTRPIPVKVRASTEVTASQVIGGSTNHAITLHLEEEAAMRPAGIRMDPSSSEAAPLIGNPLKASLIAALGPITFLLTALFVLVRRHTPAFLLASRRRRAFSRAKSVLKSHPDSNSCAILRQYLADRFNIRTDALTPSEAQTLLTNRGIPPDLAQRFSSLMQRHFDASFTHSTNREESSQAFSADGSSDRSALESTLSEIERHLDSPQVKPASRGALGLLILFLASLPSLASTPAERAFIWDEGITEMSSAHSPKEFLAAAETFQKLVDLGVRNPSLFYNQGTALLMAGKPDDAIGVLLRAERYGGSTPDIRRNLAIAEARKAGYKMPVASWLRLILFWHYGFDCATRMALVAAAFSGLWLAWAIRLIGFRRIGQTLTIISLILLITFGSSVLSTIQQESRIQRPISVDIHSSEVYCPPGNRAAHI